jgi:hypothetical protein
MSVQLSVDAKADMRTLTSEQSGSVILRPAQSPIDIAYASILDRIVSLVSRQIHRFLVGPLLGLGSPSKITDAIVTTVVVDVIHGVIW